MGIRELFPFVKKYAPAAVRWVGKDLSLADKRLAVDVAIAMYQGINIIGTTDQAALRRWFGSQHRRFLSAGAVRVVYVFDGARLDIKDQEVARRKEANAHAAHRARLAVAAFEECRRTADAALVKVMLPSSVPPPLEPVAPVAAESLKRKRQDEEEELAAILLGEEYVPPSASKRSATTDVVTEPATELTAEPTAKSAAAGAGAEPEPEMTPEELDLVLAAVQTAEMEARTAQVRVLRPTGDSYAAVREYLQTLDHAVCVTAPSEAEQYCAHLSRTGHVDLVVTKDSDALPFGAVETVVNWGKDDAYIVNLATVLEALGTDLRGFRHLCVMFGCDFVSRIPGVGPERAFSRLRDPAVGFNIDALLTLRHPTFDQWVSEAALESNRANHVKTLTTAEERGTRARAADNVTLEGKHVLAAASARSSIALVDKQLEGLRKFKREWLRAYEMFAQLDGVAVPDF